MATIPKLMSCLWFESEADEAANHYVKSIPGSRIVGRLNNPGDSPSGKAGSLLTVTIELAGHHIILLNGGPLFKPTEATSFLIACEDQAEVDFLWDHLAEGGTHSMCGWLKDRWGHSWQIVPKRFLQLMEESDASVKQRIFAAMMEMTKFDIAAIERAARQ